MYHYSTSVLSTKQTQKSTSSHQDTSTKEEESTSQQKSTTDLTTKYNSTNQIDLTVRHISTTNLPTKHSVGYISTKANSASEHTTTTHEATETQTQRATASKSTPSATTTEKTSMEKSSTVLDFTIQQGTSNAYTSMVQEISSADDEKITSKYTSGPSEALSTSTSPEESTASVTAAATPTNTHSDHTARHNASKGNRVTEYANVTMAPPINQQGTTQLKDANPNDASSSTTSEHIDAENSSGTSSVGPTPKPPSFFTLPGWSKALNYPPVSRTIKIDHKTLEAVGGPIIGGFMIVWVIIFLTFIVLSDFNKIRTDLKNMMLVNLKSLFTCVPLEKPADSSKVRA